MKLLELAHSRSGDKGDISNISVIVFDKKDYPIIESQLTVERIRSLFKDVVKGEIVRYQLPSLGALNFVMNGALGGGVTRTLNLDAHGKCLSSYLLDMEIEEYGSRV
jgi:hypothetical protein